MEYKLVEKFILVDGVYSYIGVFGLEDTLAIECMDDEVEAKEIFN